MACRWRRCRPITEIRN